MNTFIYCPLVVGRWRLLVFWLAVLLAPPAARAQAPAWQTAVVLDGPSNTLASATDEAGNVYIVGYFTGTARFGSITLTQVRVGPSGPFSTSDAFVAKWSPASGDFVWARQTGGLRNSPDRRNGEDRSNAVVVQGANVYIAGTFTGDSLRLGGLVLPNTVHDLYFPGPGPSFPVSAYYYPSDSFVAKLTDTGDFVWAQVAGRIGGTDEVGGLAVNGANVYVTGIGLQSPERLTRTLPTVFVSKFTDAGATGSFGWAQTAAGTPGAPGLQASGVAVSGNSVYLTGYFSGAAPAFPSDNRPAAIRFGPVLLTGPSTAAEVFVAKLTDAGPTGDFVWAQRAGSSGADYSSGIAAQGTAVYVAGKFAGPADFGALTPAAGNGGFVAKLTDAGPTGDFVWAQRVGPDTAPLLAVSQSNVYLAGTFASDTVRFGQTVLAKVGANDNVFVAKLVDAGPTGNFAWAQQASGSGAPTVRGLSANGATVSAVGTFAGTFNFGQLAITNPRTTAVPFLATLNDAPAPPAASASRVKAGGGALATSCGTFAADQYYSADSQLFATTAGIRGTADPALYQTERYSANGRLSYALPVANGTYTVVLHFAEIYWYQAGARVFDVNLEGAKVLDDYDIVKKVGTLTATTETFVVTVTDGVLNVDLSALPADGGRDQAKLSALEVLPARPVYRVKAGGGALATARGAFAADQSYSADTHTYATAAAIAGTPDPALYQTERYSANGRLAYALPVANGTYTVVLHFAEIYWYQAGARVFDVSLEGAKVLDDYDIVKKAGTLTATTETFVVAVTDGVLNVDLSALPADGGRDQAKLSALEVFSGAGSATGNRLVASRGAGAGAAAEPAPALSAYPNPTSGRFTVACTARAAQGATLLLTDPLGRVAQQQVVQLQAGRNEVVLQAGAQAPGLYVLTLRTADGQRQRLKVLVQP